MERCRSLVSRVRIALIERTKLVSSSVLRVACTSGLNVVSGSLFVCIITAFLLRIALRDNSAFQGRYESVFSWFYSHVCQTHLLVAFSTRFSALTPHSGTRCVEIMYFQFVLLTTIFDRFRTLNDQFVSLRVWVPVQTDEHLFDVVSSDESEDVIV
jgi:hypothetical protein